MHAIIVGAGEVGYDVARMLSHQSHDVVVIDTSADKLAHLRDKLDVMTVHGSGTSATTLLEARVRNANLIVAVTNVDEVNLIACMMAERVSKARITTIARVRSGEFTRDAAVLTMKDFGIDLLIHPEESTATEIVSLLRRASATDVVSFGGGRLQLIGIRLDRDASVLGRTLREISADFAHLTFRIMAISRGMRTIVPRGHETLEKEDQVFVLMETRDTTQVVEMLGKGGARLEDVMILGGSRVASRVASRLSRERQGKRMRIKLIEPDRDRAHLLAEELEDVLVIHGSPSDIDLLAVEGIGEMDALVAVTPDEESNLVSCLMAKHLGVRKTVAMLSKSAYIPLTQAIGLDAAVSQKMAVSREVLRFLRGKHVLSVVTIHGLEAEIMEVEVGPRSAATRGPLMEQSLPEGILVGAVIGRSVEIATGHTEFHPGDSVIVFATPDRANEVERYFGSVDGARRRN